MSFGIHLPPDPYSPFDAMPREVLAALVGPTAQDELNAQLLGAHQQREAGVNEPATTFPDLQRRIDAQR